MAVAGDGADALKRLRCEEPYQDQSLPDLILLDLNLPKVSGQEVLAQVLADPTLARIPVVVLTASYGEHDVLRSLHFGACAFMTKPVDFPQLLGLVSDIEMLGLTIVVPLSV